MKEDDKMKNELKELARDFEPNLTNKIKKLDDENIIYEEHQDDSFYENLFCDNTGFCEGSRCPRWLECQGLHY